MPTLILLQAETCLAAMLFKHYYYNSSIHIVSIYQLKFFTHHLRFLFFLSGTEDLVRVYAEAATQALRVPPLTKLSFLLPPDLHLPSSILLLT